MSVGGYLCNIYAEFYYDCLELLQMSSYEDKRTERSFGSFRLQYKQHVR